MSCAAPSPTRYVSRCVCTTTSLIRALPADHHTEGSESRAVTPQPTYWTTARAGWFGVELETWCIERLSVYVGIELSSTTCFPASARVRRWISTEQSPNSPTDTLTCCGKTNVRAHAPRRLATVTLVSLQARGCIAGARGWNGACLCFGETTCGRWCSTATRCVQATNMRGV